MPSHLLYWTEGLVPSLLSLPSRNLARQEFASAIRALKSSDENTENMHEDIRRTRPYMHTVCIHLWDVLLCTENKYRHGCIHLKMLCTSIQVHSCARCADARVHAKIHVCIYTNTLYQRIDMSLYTFTCVLVCIYIYL